MWIPQETILLVSNPNNPKAIRIVKKPEVGLFLREAQQDRDFYVIFTDGKEWLTNKKYVKRLRSEHVS